MDEDKSYTVVTVAIDINLQISKRNGIQTTFYYDERTCAGKYIINELYLECLIFFFMKSLFKLHLACKKKENFKFIEFSYRYSKFCFYGSEMVAVISVFTFKG